MPSPEEPRSRSSRDSAGAHKNRGTHRKSKTDVEGGSKKHKKSSRHRRKHTKPDQEVVLQPRSLVEYDDVSSNSSFFDEPVREKSFDRRPSPEQELDRRRSIQRQDARLAESTRTKKSKKRRRREQLLARSGGGSRASRSRETFAREDFGKERIASTSKDNSYLNHARPPDYAYSASAYQQPGANTREKKRGRTPETPRAYRNRSPSPLKNTQNRTHHSRKRSSDKRRRPKIVSKSPSPYARNASAWSASRSRSKTPNR